MNRTPQQRLEFADEIMDKMVLFNQFDANLLIALRYSYSIAHDRLNFIESRRNGYNRIQKHNARWYCKIKYPDKDFDFSH